MDQKKYHRWEPQKLFITEILSSEPTKVTDTTMALETVHKLFFKRVMIVGVVVGLSILEKRESKKDFAYITVDDGTGRINCNLFDPSDFEMIRSLAMGKSVLVLGLAYKRETNDQERCYIVPEAIREIDLPERNFFMIHTLFLRIYNRMPVVGFPTGLTPVLAEAGISVQQVNGTTHFSLPDKEHIEVKPTATEESWIITLIKDEGENVGEKKRIHYDTLLKEATKRKFTQNALEKELLTLLNNDKIVDIDGEWYELP